MICMPVWWRINSAKIHHSVGVCKSGRERHLGSLGEETSVDCSFVGECVASFLLNSAVQFPLSEDCLRGFTVPCLEDPGVWAFGFPLFRSLPGFFFLETFPDSLTWVRLQSPHCCATRLFGWSVGLFCWFYVTLFVFFMALSPACDYITCILLPYRPSSHYLLAIIPIANAVTGMNLVNIVFEANRRLLFLFYRQMEPGLRLKINSCLLHSCSFPGTACRETVNRAVLALPVSPQSAT